MCSTSFSERERRSSFQTTTASPSRSAPAYGAARVGPNGQGEIRDRTFENQSFQASGLSLIAAAIVHWNTVYLDRAVRHLRARGFTIPDDLLAHVAPLGWGAHRAHRRLHLERQQPQHRLPAATRCSHGVLGEKAGLDAFQINFHGNGNRNRNLDQLRYAYRPERNALGRVRTRLSAGGSRIRTLGPGSARSLRSRAFWGGVGARSARQRSSPNRPIAGRFSADTAASRPTLRSRRRQRAEQRNLTRLEINQPSPSFGRTQAARRRIAASASGAVPARNWKTCWISGTISSVTSTPELRARSASLRLSSSNVSSAPV